MVSSWTDRGRLQRQYVSPGNLLTRVGLYGFLVPDQDLGMRTFEDWVLDHHRWAGTESVLDVGRGAGAYELALWRRADRIVGVDLSSGMLVPVTDASRASLVVGDAQQLPFSKHVFDVGLAAHMLYHVPDISRALGELVRALRPGGTALLVANGSDDKQEILALWQEAAAAVSGSFSLPAWTGRFNIDNGVDLVEQMFRDISVDVLTGQFRFPTPEPVMAWVNSLRAGTEQEIETATWNAVAAELQMRLEQRIERLGHFTARKSSGVIVAH